MEKQFEFMRYNCIVLENKSNYVYSKGSMANQINLIWCGTELQSLMIQIKAKSDLDALIIDKKYLDLLPREVFLELKEAVKVIIVSGGSPTDALEAFRLGVDSFITRPLSPEKISLTVNRLFNRINEPQKEVILVDKGYLRIPLFNPPQQLVHYKNIRTGKILSYNKTVGVGLITDTNAEHIRFLKTDARFVPVKGQNVLFEIGFRERELAAINIAIDPQIYE